MPSNFLDKLQEALNPSDSAIKGSGLIVGMSAVLIAATAVTNPIAASMLLCAGMSVSLQVITDCIEGNKTSISSLVTSAAVGAASGAVAGVTAAATEIAITELGYNAASHFAVATISGASGMSYDVTTQLLTTGKVDAKEALVSGAVGFVIGGAISAAPKVVEKLNSKAVVAEKAEKAKLVLQDETGEFSLSPNKNSGEVVFKAPPNSTPEEIEQFKQYVDGCNEALEAGYLSDSGRVSTKGILSKLSSKSARTERLRALNEGNPYIGHVGHVPDTTWTDNPVPFKYLDLSPRVNSSLGGQAGHYPVGYKPTKFIFLER